ncbi:hypothetical protein LCGC14_2559320 [marine sediment metagenome]|uniref:Uncharacterized protein n=1 Tax=marine sediment metagenome TaxID=412755 RepID=A0A0F9CWP9_9ZZZZ
MMRHPPKFCSECGKVLFGEKAWTEYWIRFNKNIGRGYIGLGYNCHCDHCGWSGNIEPDKDDLVLSEEIED